MNLAQILAHIPTLNDDDLDELATQANAQQVRRWATQHAPARAEQVVAARDEELDQIASSWHTAHEGTGTEEHPVPWRPPAGPSRHDAWPRDSWVLHAGKVWHNPHPVNSAEPGTPGSRWVHKEDA